MALASSTNKVPILGQVLAQFLTTLNNFDKIKRSFKGDGNNILFKQLEK
jgi:hypothetical protein